ncbi:MAG TPA: YdeI/OmpD-associated family protein [Actinomycetes bacterium]|nr:YdeI/OmpD-associated family protein [Actinomycetes bacterium]
MASGPLEELKPENRAVWRGWLAEHHGSSPGVWLIWDKKGTGRQRITLDEAVEEALCFGWIDSRLQPLGDGRSALRFTPRKPKSIWSRRNKQRVAALVAAGLMTDAGQRVVEAAKRDGSWEALDAVDDLRVPDDLALALAGNPVAEANFQAFTASARKAALWWITSAKRPETRAKRVAETVRLAAGNLTVADRPHRRS